MGSLQLSAGTLLINTKTLLGTSTIINISFRNIINVWSTFRSFFLEKCRCSAFLTRVPWVRVLGVTSVERGNLADLYQNVARDLNYFQHKFKENHLCRKYIQMTFHVKNVDFRCFWRGYPKLGYMVSLQLSAATWLINTKTLLRTSTIPNIIFRNITNV